MNTLGYGSLVYNYFGSEGAAKSCSDNSGSEKPPVCEPEPYAKAVATRYNGASRSRAGAIRDENSGGGNGRGNSGGQGGAN
jgi:hypothetical protein